MGRDLKLEFLRDRRRYYAFVEAVSSAIEGNNYSRAGLVLDCVDAERFSPDQHSEKRELVFIRVATTPTVFSQRFGLPGVPKEGDWLVIETDAWAQGPLAWVLSAADDYQGPAAVTRLASVAPLPRDDHERRLSESNGFLLGELAHDADMLAAFCVCTTSADSNAAEDRFTLTNLSNLHVRVVDVGQASCNALHKERRADAPVFAFFDVGAPVFWNRKSLLNRKRLRKTQIDSRCIVILSHWDFDHYALAFRELASLRNHRWFAPEQSVGPNAVAFQRSLGDRLGFVKGETIGLSGNAILHKGQGPQHDRNGSGYVLRLDRRVAPVVLTGDVSYGFIPPAALVGATAITVPHHGGPDTAPPPAGGGRAVASYGLPNCYRHPCNDVIASHDIAPWALETTAERHGVARGDRWL